MCWLRVVTLRGRLGSTLRPDFTMVERFMNQSNITSCSKTSAIYKRTSRLGNDSLSSLFFVCYQLFCHRKRRVNYADEYNAIVHIPVQWPNVRYSPAQSQSVQIILFNIHFPEFCAELLLINSFNPLQMALSPRS